MEEPRSPFAPDIDDEILPLIKVMNKKGRLVTLGCCCGHEGRPSRSPFPNINPCYIDLAVNGTAEVQKLVRKLNLLRDLLRDKLVDFRVELNWDEEVATAGDPKRFPSWIMLSITIHEGWEGTPSTSTLKELAALWLTAKQ